MNCKKFNLEKFEFIDDSDKSKKLLYSIRSRIRPRIGTGGTPVWLKKQYKPIQSTKKREPILGYLCEAIGFNDPAIQKLIFFHKSRLLLRSKVGKTISLLIAVPTVMIVTLGLFGLIITYKPLINKLIIENAFLAVFAVIMFYCIIILFTIIVTRIAVKTASTLIDKNFADTLCAATCVYLVIELNRDDVLAHPKKKKALIARLNDLARNTALLPLCYASKNEINQIWAKEHFTQMEQYIRERERWVIAPSESTLLDLRRDFYNLAIIYITGGFGKFDWTTTFSKLELAQTTQIRSLVSGLSRTAGVVLPLIFLGIVLWQHSQLEAVGLGANLVALILIAWFLLAIDAALKLGIVAGVINLAKEIKNLK